MANWNAPQPRDTWTPKERADFEREVWTRVKFGSFDWTPPLIAANTTTAFVVGPGAAVDTRVTVGLRVGMPVSVTAPDVMVNGLSAQALVAANDTLTIAIANVTAGGLTPPAGTWAFQGMVI